MQNSKIICNKKVYFVHLIEISSLLLNITNLLYKIALEVLFRW